MLFEWTDADGDRCGLGEDGRLYIFNELGIESRWVFAVAEVAESGLVEALRQREVCRKALEPFASLLPRFFYEGADVVYLELSVDIPGEHYTALVEACRLMGLPLEGEPNSDG